MARPLRSEQYACHRQHPKTPANLQVITRCRACQTLTLHAHRGRAKAKKKSAAQSKAERTDHQVTEAP
jgi:hypothetical protein